MSRQLLFLIKTVCPIFLQLSILAVKSLKNKHIESCKKFGQTELIKKSNRTILTDFCMQFLFSYNLETQNWTEKLDFACKIFPK